MRRKALGAVGAAAIIVALFGGFSSASASYQCVPKTGARLCLARYSGNFEVDVIANNNTSAGVAAGRTVDGAAVVNYPNAYRAVLFCENHSWHLFTQTGQQGHDRDLNLHCG